MVPFRHSDRFDNKHDYMQFMDAMERLTKCAGMSGLEHVLLKYREVDVLRQLWSYMDTNQLNDEDLLRVSVDPDGKFDIVDFTTPRRSGKVLFQKAEQEQIPAWIIETISMLRMTESNSVVGDLGLKVSDRVYYIIDRRNEHECKKD
jgi:hypothetical protein